MSKSGNLAVLAAILDTNDKPDLYYAEDPPYLPRILVFYSPVHTYGATSSASRIRTAVLSTAGFKSFPAIQVSPSSSFYSAVHKLPSDQQRDDVSRGIAFTLFKYFSELSPALKTAITDEHVQHGIGLKWGQTHAAQITSRLGRVINSAEVIEALRPYAKRPSSSSILKAVSSPSPITAQKSIRRTRPSYIPSENASNGAPHYGLRIPSKGSSSPVAVRNKRVPSGQLHLNTARHTSSILEQQTHQTVEQKETLRFQMCEFVDTEDNYITRLQSLLQLASDTFTTRARSFSSRSSNNREKAALSAISALPSLLDQMLDLNTAFLDDMKDILEKTEESAMECLANSSAASSEETATSPTHSRQSLLSTKDPLGAHAFAKVLLAHFPKFLVPYREYLDLHTSLTPYISQLFNPSTSTAQDTPSAHNTMSAQLAPSLLVEPAQRISRYALLVTTMLASTIPGTPTQRSLQKARAMIAEICEMETPAGVILEGLHVQYEIAASAAGGGMRSLSPTKILSGLGWRKEGVVVREVWPVGENGENGGGGGGVEGLKLGLVPSLSRGFSRRGGGRSKGVAAAGGGGGRDGLGNGSTNANADAFVRNQTRRTSVASTVDVTVRPKSKDSTMTLKSNVNGGTVNGIATANGIHTALNATTDNSGRTARTASEEAAMTIARLEKENRELRAENEGLRNENGLVKNENAQLKREVRGLKEMRSGYGKGGMEVGKVDKGEAE